MASMPVKRVPSKDVIILPAQRDSPRFGLRTSHEHDMNDAIAARFVWYDQMKAREKQMVDEAGTKAGTKVKDEIEKEKNGKAMATVFLVLAVIAGIGIYKFFIG